MKKYRKHSNCFEGWGFGKDPLRGIIDYWPLLFRVCRGVDWGPTYSYNSEQLHFHINIDSSGRNWGSGIGNNIPNDSGIQFGNDWNWDLGSFC